MEIKKDNNSNQLPCTNCIYNKKDGCICDKYIKYRDSLREELEKYM